MKPGEFMYDCYEYTNGRIKVDISFNYGEYVDSYGRKRDHIGYHSELYKTTNKKYALRQAKKLAKKIF